MTRARYVAPTISIPLGGENQPLPVRGLGLQEIAILIREHMPDLEGIVEMVMATEDWRDLNLGPLAGSLVSQAPGLAANIIALSAGEPDFAADVMTMPIGVQAKLLNAISQLTFEDVGGIKNGLGVIMGLLKKMDTKSMQTMMKASKTVAREVESSTSIAEPVAT